MKKCIWIIMLCSMAAGCATSPPARQEAHALLAYAELATEITVVRQQPGDEPRGAAARKR